MLADTAGAIGRAPLARGSADPGLSLARGQRVLQQYHVGDRTHAAGHRGRLSGDPEDAFPLEAAHLFAVVAAHRRHIDDNGAGLDRP